MKTTKSPDYSPWGTIQAAAVIAPGITHVTTAAHGGIHVRLDLMSRMPEYMRSTSYSQGGWFEEDCDWCLPFVVFEALLRESGDTVVVKMLDDGEHLKTFAAWHPERYRRFFGVEVAAGHDGCANVGVTQPAARLHEVVE